MSAHVVALPGGVMPAAIRYEPLRAALDDQVKLHLKDLEVYSADEPPPGYSTTMEVDALTRFADALGLERFHLLGYSGGGLVSLAFAGTYPERLKSLALFEPAFIPGPLTAEEADFREALRRELEGKSGPEFMRAFTTLQVKAGVELPPMQGPLPPGLSNRPRGLSAMMAAFEAHPFERDSLRRCQFPVFFAYGDQTAIHQEVWAGVLSRLLPDIHIRRFEGIHHFVPPAEIYHAGHVRELRELWARTD